MFYNIPSEYPKFNGEQLCAQTDPEIFFTEKPDSNITKKLRVMCAHCPKLVQCSDYAIEHEAHGFWGGYTARERGLIRKRRNIILQNKQRMSAA